MSSGGGDAVLRAQRFVAGNDECVLVELFKGKYVHALWMEFNQAVGPR